MAATAGTSILVKVSTTTITLTDNATLTMNFGNEEITDFGDLWKATLSTVRDWSLAISGSYDKSDSGQDTAIYTEILSGDGAIADIRFYIDSNYYYGACCITSATIGATATGKITFSANFVGNGTLAYA
jgi:predicted secreted protein